MQESIHQAATIIFVREREHANRQALEVYMTKRPATMRFLANHHVFPGGQMDADDQDPRFEKHCVPLLPFQNPVNLPLSYWVTALRESFEEVGILLARDVHGNFVSPASLAAQREQLLAGELSFYEIIEKANLQLATDKLRYFGHRLTPRKVSLKRFETRFFLTQLPAGLEPLPHQGEIAEAYWIEPQAALEKWASGEMEMVPPTVDSLRVIGRYTQAETLRHSTEGVGTPTTEELA